MAITSGFNHVATLTTDLDRFTAWYGSVGIVFGIERLLAEGFDKPRSFGVAATLVGLAIAVAAGRLEAGHFPWPPQLRSPMVDQVRAATRGGTRPGLSEDAMARMKAAAERRKAMAPPMPPKLMAQEARWDRDAWTATVNGTTPATGAGSVLPKLPQLPEAAVAQAAGVQQASVLPRLPGTP